MHAVRNLVRLGIGRGQRPLVAARLRPHVVDHRAAQATPRNLFGFKDGTDNLKAEDTDRAATSSSGSADGDGRGLDGRRLLPGHPPDPDADRDLGPHARWPSRRRSIGRTKGSGAPLGRRARVRRAVDFAAHGADGEPAIAARRRTSALAHPSQQRRRAILRRGYNFVDGSDGLGRLDAGLFFIAYQRDPRSQFVPMQRKLARHDAMNEYIRHVSSGRVRLPARGTRRRRLLGRGLFG